MSPISVDYTRKCKVEDNNGKVKLRIILDKYSAEVFINDGEKVMTMTMYTDLSADGIPGAAIDEVLDDDGYVLGVSYKGAKSDVVGSWGLGVKYYDQGAQTYVAHTTDANTFGMTGFKGYGITADYTLAKNIVASVAYYDTESKLADKAGLDLDDQRIFTEVNFYF